MISFSDKARIYIKTEHIDFRCGLNKLVPLARSCFDVDPKSEVIFVFRNRRKTDIKMIFFDRNGYFMGHKRFSSGKLKWWPRNEAECYQLDAGKLMKLLLGVDPRGNFHPDWSEVHEERERSKNDKDRRSSWFGRKAQTEPVEPRGYSNP